MLRHTTTRRGTALVITVGLLAVLAVIGFGFAVLMKLNVETSGHYAAASKVDLLAHAVFAYAVRDIRFGWSNAKEAADTPPSVNEQLHSYQSGAAFEPTDNPAAPWFIDAATASGMYKDDTGIWRYCYSRNNSYAKVHDVLGDRVAVSYAKVLDSASKINVNDDNPRIDDILDTLFDELAVNTVIDKPAPGPYPALNLTGDDVVNFRNNLEGQRLSTLEQLKQIPPLDPRSGISRRMTVRRFDVLKHYLTIYSWPHDPPSVQNFEFYPIRPFPTGPPARTLVAGGTGDDRCSPININTAPREVLVAILSNVKLNQPGSTSLGDTKAREIADWILRKRDPENRKHWTADFSTSWKNWHSDSNYKTYIRKHTVASWVPPGSAPSSAYGVSGWRHYPFGPFDTWNEFVDFMYSLTKAANTGVNDDPFDKVTGLTMEEVEAVLAALNPNPMATLCPRNTWHMSYTRLRKDRYGQQRLRDRDMALLTNESASPSIYGKNDLASDGYTAEVCFSSRGRFEIASRTFAFVKADAGQVSLKNWYRLSDDSKSWGTAPPQWRGYSVLIYDGKGKGQLRAIVKNDANSLTVGRWSTELSDSGSDRSRYYIVGPGPLLERSRVATVSLSRPHVLADVGAQWEDDEWNGYRIVVYQATLTTETGPGGKPIQTENINEGSIQERIIIDTDGDNHTLILSPELNTNLGTTALSYIILGSEGNAAHDAALKAYDVIYHSTEKDFADTGYATSGTDLGPNPLRLGAPASNKEGYITVKDKDETRLNAFVHNFKNPGLAPDQFGLLVGGNATLADVFLGPNEGTVFSDGLYLRSGAGRYAAFRTTTNPALVTNRLPAQSPSYADGGFVSFWFRPDQDCFSGTARTLIRIQGPTASDDLRLRIQGWTLMVNLRVGSKRQPYGTLTTRRADGTVGPLMVYCRPRSETVSGLSVALNNTTSPAVDTPWRPGEWHHIALAWYECYDDPARLTNDDNDGQTDMHSDGPPLAPKYDELDQYQVRSAFRLWLDGVAHTTSRRETDAINLIPDAQQAHLWIGEPSYPPAGTIDGIIAYTHTDKNLADSTFNVPSTTVSKRYEGGTGYATYTSPTITLPTGISGEPVCLGTITWTAFLPWMRRNYSGVAGVATTVAGNYPVYFTATLTGGQPSATSKQIPANGSLCQPIFGGGGPVVTATGEKIRATSGSTITYKAYLSSYLDTSLVDTSIMKIPQNWQTPLIDDVTITYLGPVAFYHWR